MTRRFELHRIEDISGVSGTGVVAHGVVWPDGTCALRWDSGDLASTVVYDNLRTLEAIHGHGGMTRVVFVDRTEREAVTGADFVFRHRGDDTVPLPLPPATCRDLREVL